MAAPDVRAAFDHVFANAGEDIACVYLYGSRARGDARAESDFDVAVLFVHAPPATLDLASHIVSDERLGEPQTNGELFVLLERAGWLPADLAARMQAIAGFRNLVMHGYAKIDPGILADIVRHRLGDRSEFVAAIRQRVAAC